jgi:hypothetical protein
MKKQASIIAATIVVGFLTVFTAQAQTSNTRLTTTIPFEFYVKDRVMPAGEYSVTCLNPTSPNRVLQFRGKDGAGIVIQTGNTVGKRREDARLVFHRIGKKYFLSQAWLPADDNGLTIQKSRIEKELERQVGEVNVSRTAVALTVRRR